MNPELDCCTETACWRSNRNQFNTNKFVELIQLLPQQENITEVNYSEYGLTIRYRNGI